MEGCSWLEVNHGQRHDGESVQYLDADRPVLLEWRIGRVCDEKQGWKDRLDMGLTWGV